MTIRALADTKYIRKYLFLAAAGLALSLWASYDAFYAYPKELEMAMAFEQIKDQEDAIQQWAVLYEENKERGWHREKPENAPETIRGNILFNYGLIAVGLGLLGFFLQKYFRTKRSWMESTDTGINTSWGKSLDFTNVTKINKKRWEAKGIAKVFYTDDSGKNQTMVFDDFKYERAPMGELMAMCEQHLTPDQIVGGKSQAEIAAATDESEDEESNADASEPVV